MLRGDFGESFFFKKQVADADRASGWSRRWPSRTCTIVLAVAMAVPLGVLAAWRRGTWIDRGVMGFSVLGFSVPVFVIGYMLIYSSRSSSSGSPCRATSAWREGFGGFLQRLVLPSVTLAVIYVALIARITRASVLEVLNADYVRTARAKGLPMTSPCSCGTRCATPRCRSSP